jgi:uncharacterized protein (DUF779 family)
MSEPALVPRVVASPAATEAIRSIRTEHGQLMFYQSGGCCDGSLPMCFQAGELLIGDGDVMLGILDGCPFYIDGRQDAAWGYPEFLLDVAPSPPEGFSLPAGRGQHFVTRSSLCATEPPDKPGGTASRG